MSKLLIKDGDVPIMLVNEDIQIMGNSNSNIVWIGGTPISFKYEPRYKIVADDIDIREVCRLDD